MVFVVDDMVEVFYENGEAEEVGYCRAKILEVRSGGYLLDFLDFKIDNPQFPDDDSHKLPFEDECKANAVRPIAPNLGDEVPNGRNTIDMFSKSRFAEVDVFEDEYWLKGFVIKYDMDKDEATVVVFFHEGQKEKSYLVSDGKIRLHYEWATNHWEESIHNMWVRARLEKKEKITIPLNHDLRDVNGVSSKVYLQQKGCCYAYTGIDLSQSRESSTNNTETKLLSVQEQIDFFGYGGGKVSFVCHNGSHGGFGFCSDVEYPCIDEISKASKEAKARCCYRLSLRHKTEIHRNARLKCAKDLPRHYIHGAVVIRDPSIDEMREEMYFGGTVSFGINGAYLEKVKGNPIIRRQRKRNKNGSYVKVEDADIHAVLGTGFGVENETEFFWIKNTHGTVHGDKGFYRIAVDSLGLDHIEMVIPIIIVK